jgi:AraC-like DNA-binding protein
MHDFDRHPSIEGGVGREENHSHTPATQLSLQPILRPERCLKSGKEVDGRIAQVRDPWGVTSRIHPACRPAIPPLPRGDTSPANLNWMLRNSGGLPEPAPVPARFRPDVTRVRNVSYLILFDVLAVASHTTYREDSLRAGLEDGGAPTVATVLLPVERSRVDAAGSGCFAVVHRDSIPDAVRIVRERPVDAVLVSVHRCSPEQVEVLGHLVREFPGIPTVALVSQHDPTATEMLLRLGASGVRQVVDVTSPTGWSRLRQVVGQPATRAVARIQGPILDALAGVPADTRLFIEAVIRLAPDTPTVTTLAQRLYVRPSTLMSRFARAGLPSPKNYLAAIRLLHAAYLFEATGLSVADVSYRLEYSSPQSFGRHLRAMLGVTAIEFRRRFPFPVALQRFVDLLLVPRPGAGRKGGHSPLPIPITLRRPG